MDHSSIDRQERYRYLFYTVVALLVFLFSFAAWSASNPAPPAGDWRPMPDPTPFVVETQRIEILSNNCMGWNVSCNNQ